MASCSTPLGPSRRARVQTKPTRIRITYSRANRPQHGPAAVGMSSAHRHSHTRWQLRQPSTRCSCQQHARKLPQVPHVRACVRACARARLSSSLYDMSATSCTRPRKPVSASTASDCPHPWPPVSEAVQTRQKSEGVLRGLSRLPLRSTGRAEATPHNRLR